MTGKAVRLRRDQQTAVGRAFVEKLIRMKCDVLILSCGPTHVHVLMAPSERQVKRQVGRAKQFASLRCPGHRGQLWGEGCEVEAVHGIAHARRVFAYIRDHQRKEGAWIWRFDKQDHAV